MIHSKEINLFHGWHISHGFVFAMVVSSCAASCLISIAGKVRVLVRYGASCPCGHFRLLEQYLISFPFLYALIWKTKQKKHTNLLQWITPDVISWYISYTCTFLIFTNIIFNSEVWKLSLCIAVSICSENSFASPLLVPEINLYGNQ